MSQPIWVPGQGFGNQPAKKVILKPQSFGFSLTEKPSDLVALKQSIQSFIKINEPLLGFIAWNGYEVEGIGAGVVYCDADGGIEATAIAAQYVPAATILAVLRDQKVPEANVLSMEQELQNYDARKLFFVIVSLHGMIYPMSLQSEELSPPEYYAMMTESDESTEVTDA